MSSIKTFTKSDPPARSRRTLQRLRREAGYRSAKDFAEAIGVPVSTYARFERAGDGPDCGIPLPRLWAIADALGCTIDLVVGREDVDAPRHDSVQSRYDALGPAGRQLVESYLSYVEESESQGSRPGARRC